MRYKEIIKEYEDLKSDVYRVAAIITDEIKKVLPEAEVFEFNKCISPDFGLAGVTFASFLAEYNHIDRVSSFITWAAFIPEGYFYLSPIEIRKRVRKDLEEKNYGWLFAPIEGIR